jgi:hypothetical protein
MSLESTPLQLLRAALANWILAGVAVLSATGLTAQEPFADDETIEPAAESRGDAAEVSVLAQSGRTFVGLVDARTDGETLWLRFEHGRSTMWRPIAWQRVRQVSASGETFAADGVRRGVGRFG